MNDLSKTFPHADRPTHQDHIENYPDSVHGGHGVGWEGESASGGTVKSKQGRCESKV